MLRLVLVRFKDTTTHDHWTAVDIVKSSMECIDCKAVGWIMEETVDTIKLASLMDSQENVSGTTILVPKGGCIIEDISIPGVQNNNSPKNP